MKNDHEDSANEFSLPSRREYHKRRKKKRNKRQRQWNPFWPARLILAFFLLLVLAVFGYSVLY